MAHAAVLAVRGQEARRCRNELHSASLSVCCSSPLRAAAAVSDFASSPISSCVLFVQFITSWLQRALAGIREAVEQRPEGARNHVGIQIHFRFESNEKTLITLFARSSTRCLLSCPLSSQVTSNPCAFQRPAVTKPCLRS